ncbi:hypothetical protein [Streptococcus uberis]|uniref:hypothetical protein n=1 Tax=Streptococcus uberis TaxID=1349 RepID=UPI00062032BD|nr:hypothetical protein [Streptococcus uberis]KKF47521.1 hypothetical protein AF62_09795 [Streptococcus uberis C8329]QBX12079.1 terminase large subunit [Streptococcus satellite phage Javan632]
MECWYTFLERFTERLERFNEVRLRNEHRQEVQNVKVLSRYRELLKQFSNMSLWFEELAEFAGREDIDIVEDTFIRQEVQNGKR